MKKMDYIKLLKNGYKITIYDNLHNNCIATTFLWHNDCIYYDNKCLGFYPHDAFNKDNSKLAKHIDKMLKDNLSIKIEL